MSDPSYVFRYDTRKAPIFGISDELLVQLRECLYRCSDLEDRTVLRALFVDDRISAWRDLVPEQSNLRDRVSCIIDALYDQYNDKGENALGLFLRVLSAKIDKQDGLKDELTTLQEELSAKLETFENLALETKSEMIAEMGDLRKAIENTIQSRLTRVFVSQGMRSSHNLLPALDNDRLVAWHEHVSALSERGASVADIIVDLCDQYNADDGVNALVGLLRVWAEQNRLPQLSRGTLFRLSEDIEAELPAPNSGTLAQWEAPMQCYRQAITARFKNIQIFGQSSPVSLDERYTDLALLNRPSASRKYDVRDLEHDPDLLEKRANTISCNTVLQVKEIIRLFILGKPGAGKTTFLKHFALYCASHNDERIPVFISIREWGESHLPLLSYITMQFQTCDFPDALHYVLYLFKKTDRAVVLFDGLDELSRNEHIRDRISMQLQSFSANFPRVSVVITCRTAATDITFQGFTYYEMADLSPEQMRIFVRNWFRERNDIADSFLREISKDMHKGLRELARQPLLLTMLCLAFGDSLTFPSRRAEIYQDALDALLRKWDSSRGIQRDTVYKGISVGRKQQLFAQLAVLSFEQDKYFLPQEWLESKISSYLSHLPLTEKQESVDVDGSGVLHAIEEQHGILVERANRVFSFAHLTFQEYYTARFITENSANDTNAFYRLLSNAHDPRWREVILITASLLSDATAFFQCFLRVLDEQTQGDSDLAPFFSWVTHTTISSPLLSNTPLKHIFNNGLFLALVISCDRTSKHIRDREGVAIPEWINMSNYNGKLKTISDQNCVLQDALRRIYSRTLLLLPPDLARELRIDLELHEISELKRKYDIDLSILDASPLEWDLTLAQIFARCLHHLPGNINVQRALKATLIRAKSLAHIFGLDELCHNLTKLISQMDTQSWGQFERVLQKIIARQHKTKPFRSLSEKQCIRIENYLISVELLMQCLDLAYIPDRSAIESKLLFPTKSGNSGNSLIEKMKHGLIQS